MQKSSIAESYDLQSSSGLSLIPTKASWLWGLGLLLPGTAITGELKTVKTVAMCPASPLDGPVRVSLQAPRCRSLRAGFAVDPGTYAACGQPVRMHSALTGLGRHYLCDICLDKESKQKIASFLSLIVTLNMLSGARSSLILRRRRHVSVFVRLAPALTSGTSPAETPSSSARRRGTSCGPSGSAARVDWAGSGNAAHEGLVAASVPKTSRRTLREVSPPVLRAKDGGNSGEVGSAQTGYEDFWHVTQFPFLPAPYSAFFGLCWPRVICKKRRKRPPGSWQQDTQQVRCNLFCTVIPVPSQVTYVCSLPCRAHQDSKTNMKHGTTLRYSREKPTLPPQCTPLPHDHIRTVAHLNLPLI
ncbi:uncharacterized protein LOC125088550 [Lutra lutra]|uniref:uncharacterized protein LOC125088550 n=1 Tax=Lutra lutra TaxID=9657 RepID=UPI001FD2FBBC|nr:uncharacterized protein LOC125088550 [Lutra lutra]